MRPHNRKKIMHKKALGSIISTVLLISLILTLSVIITIWGKKFLASLSPPVDCSTIKFNAEFSSGNLNLVNRGTIQIEGVKIMEITNNDLKNLEEIKQTIKPGSTESLKLTKTLESEEYLIIPIIETQTRTGTKLSVCNDKAGIKISNSIERI